MSLQGAVNIDIDIVLDTKAGKKSVVFKDGILLVTNVCAEVPNYDHVYVNVMCKRYTLKGELHRIDGPAIIYVNGSQTWYRDGKLHRDNDLPAIIDADGSQFWYRDGKLHRDNDLPAVIWDDGSQEWYRDGKQHRDNDLPAEIHTDGTQEWYRDGKRHRDNDLPAVIRADGSQFWHRDGEYHRDNDLPAVIWADGSQSWYRDGKLHRADGPAIEDVRNGKLINIEQWIDYVKKSAMRFD